MPLELNWRKRISHLPHQFLTRRRYTYEVQKQEQLVCWAWNELRLAVEGVVDSHQP